TEEYLDACIDSAQKMNAGAQKYNTLLAADVKKLTDESQELMLAHEEVSGKKMALLLQVQKVQALQKEAEDNLKVARKELELQQGVLKKEKDQNPERLARLQDQVNQLEKEADFMAEQTKQLADLNSRLAGAAT
ncbi:MAG: hypothetical protein HQK59_17760, partial [Deltaproteobacteria bacterium]|nr:hypothetical protein [Deltaproteobacteria bacterium]